MQRNQESAKREGENPQQTSGSRNDRSTSIERDLYGTTAESSRGGVATDKRSESPVGSKSDPDSTDFVDAPEHAKDAEGAQKRLGEQRSIRKQTNVSREGRSDLQIEPQGRDRPMISDSQDLRGVEAYPLRNMRTVSTQNMLYGGSVNNKPESSRLSREDIGHTTPENTSKLDRGERSSRREEPEITEVRDRPAEEGRDLERGDTIPGAEELKKDMVATLQSMSPKEMQDLMIEAATSALQENAKSSGKTLKEKDIQVFREDTKKSFRRLEQSQLGIWDKTKAKTSDFVKSLSWKKVAVLSLYIARDLAIGGANTVVPSVIEGKFDKSLLGSNMGASAFANRGLDLAGKFWGPVLQTGFGQGLNVAVLAGEGKFSKPANTTEGNSTTYANSTENTSKEYDKFDLNDFLDTLQKYK